MKRFSLITIIAVLTFGIIYAGSIVTVWKAKTFPVSTSRTDTSSAIDLKGNEFVELQVSTTGTDSIKLIYYIDSYMNGKYDLAVKQDSLIIDNASGDYAKGLMLRGYGTNLIPGTERIRIRTTVQCGAADDSSSATSYTEYLLMR